MSETELIAQLRALKERGLTFGQIVPIYAEDNTPRQQRLIDKARDQLEREGELEFDDETIASGSDDDGDYVLAWRWVDDDENTRTWLANFTPGDGWNGQTVPVDAEREWDASDLVRKHWDDYFKERWLKRDDDDGYLYDIDDLLKEDPAAPQWIREWTGPFAIRVRPEE